MKRLCICLMLCVTLLCACGQPNIETLPTTTSPVTEPTTEPATEPTTEPTEPPVLYRHPLTGEPLDAPFTARPMGVIINNIVDAQPLHGIGQADFLFETTAEGGGSITRCIGIFTQLEQVEKVGSIRSARTYFDAIARSFDAPMMHCGGSEYALNELSTNGQPHIDARFYDGTTFYRDAERRAAGYAYEHTMFANGADLIRLVQERGIAVTVEPGREYGLQFADHVETDGEKAVRISFRFSQNGKYTVMELDPESGCYHGTQIWSDTRQEPFADANTGKAVDYRNVILIYTPITSDGYRVFAKLDGEGDGYFAVDGKISPIKWHRAGSGNAPFTYTYPDGTPVTLGVGKTYVGILDTGLPVDTQ